MTQLIKDKLPNKPSSLIRLAVNDLNKVEKDKNYKVYMGDWHNPYSNAKGLCEVCLAGSVLAKSLDFPATNSMPWDEMALKLSNKFESIDAFRQGDIEMAFLKLGQKLPNDIPEYLCITPYNENKKLFKIDMRNLAKRLARRGL